MFDPQVCDDTEEGTFDWIVEDTIRAAAARPTRLERQAVLDLRRLLQGYQAGDCDLADVACHLSERYGALERVVSECAGHAERAPHRRQYFALTRDAYQRGQDGLSVMGLALQQGDAPRLWQGMAAFEAAVSDIDDLVEVERQCFERS